MEDSDEDVQWIGRCKVTSRGDSDARVHVMALSDLCCSSLDQFSGFFGYCRATKTVPQLDEACVHYVDLPGQSLEPRTPLESGFWPTWQTYVQEVQKVRQSLQKGSVMLGFGVGAGANILLRICEDTPSVFKGLVLVAPVVSAPGFLGWLQDLLSALFLYYIGWNDHVLSLLLQRWFANETLEYNPALRERFASAVEALSASDVARSVYAYGSRTGLQDTTARIRAHRLRAMVLCGRDSALHQDAEEAVQLFFPGQASLVDPFETGSLIIDEAPEKVVTSVALFLRTLTLT